MAIGVWTLFRVYKQVVTNMSLVRDPRGEKVNTTSPHSAVVVEVGMLMVVQVFDAQLYRDPLQGWQRGNMIGT